MVFEVKSQQKMLLIHY